MSAENLLRAGREAAEQLMVDQCRITRAGEGGPRVFNPDSGQYDNVPARVTVYTGQCRLQITSTTSTADETAGERVFRVQDAELQLPVLATVDLAVGHVVEILACPHDPALVGAQLTVASLHRKTHATARRVRVREGVS